MDTIIGIKLDVTGEELSTHCSNRSLYHKNRADLYEAEIKTIGLLRKSGDEAANSSPKSSSYSDPVESLERSMKEHKGKEKFFKFAAEHFSANSIYRINIQDTVDFELSTTRY